MRLNSTYLTAKNITPRADENSGQGLKLDSTLILRQASGINNMVNAIFRKTSCALLTTAISLQCSLPTFAQAAPISQVPADSQNIVANTVADSTAQGWGSTRIETPADTTAAPTELAYAGSATVEDSHFQAIENIDKQIAAKEVELLKLNSDFRTHYTARDKNKQRRMKFYDFAAGAVANAGDITLLSQFWKYNRYPGRGLNHRGRLEAGVITVLVAYSLLGTLYAAEGAGDLISDYKSKKEHFDAKSMRDRVCALKGSLDKLLADRATAVSQLNDLNQAERQYLTAEANVLTDFRDLGLVEFSKLYIDSRKRHSARDITTIGTLAVCATGAFPGALGVLNGIRGTNIKQIGGGGIGFLISGATLTAAPVLIHGGAAITGKVAGDRLSKELGEVQCKTVSKLSEDTKQLTSLLTASNRTVALQPRAENYQTMTKLLEERSAFLDQDKKDQKKEMIESFISYAARGGPQIAFGTCVARAGYRYNNNAYKVFKGVAQGATANEVSWAIWMLDVIQKQTRNEIKNTKEAKATVQPPFSPKNAELQKLQVMMVP
jgi:hypothetical protein